MNQLHFPFLQGAVLVPLVGAAFTARFSDSRRASRVCLVFSTVALACAIGAWLDLWALGVAAANDPWDLGELLIGRRWLTIDELSAPLLPTIALLYSLTALATLRTKMRRFSFSRTLAGEALRLALFACDWPWLLVALLSVEAILPFLELRSRGRPTRVYLLHNVLCVVLLIVGWGFAGAEWGGATHSWWAIAPLLVAILIRSGIAPLHCWVTDLFENGTFGTALLFVMPLTGAYAAVRLVLPIAPDWILRSMGLMSLVTVVYAAGMALVQREARRFFCYLFLTHSALVLVGLEMVNAIGLTGGLCLWLSTMFSLGGLGLTLRSLESRVGRISLVEYHGLFEHTPQLAMFFALTGLASVGFPGTMGFIGTEMLVDGTMEIYPYIGMTLVVAAALNGIAVVRTYFLLFTGTRHVSSVSLMVSMGERLAILTMGAVILGAGWFPQPKVASRFHAAEMILRVRRERRLTDDRPAVADHHEEEDEVAHNETDEAENP